MSAIERYLQGVSTELAAEKKAPDEIDVYQAAAAWGVSRTKAQIMLAADVKAGKLETRLVKNGHAWARVWKPIDKK